MQKSFYSNDILEFQIYHKWVKGNLINIIINEKKFIISLKNDKENTTKEQNNTLIINNSDNESIINDSEICYDMNQKIEFFDDSSKSWMEGTIKNINKDFYIISYKTVSKANNTKIIYKNNIRPLTNNKDLLKLNIDNAQLYSLKDFEKLSNPIKYAKKFINKLIFLLNENILFTFLNDDLDLFIFLTEKENNQLSNKNIIKDLIDIAINHFKEIDKAHRKLFK